MLAINDRILHEERFQNKEQIIKTSEQIVSSRYAHINIPSDTSFPEFVFHCLERHGDKHFLIDAEKRKKYSFHDVLQKSKAVATVLRRLGLEPGDVVCLCSFSRPEYFIFFLGISAAGGIITHANPLSTQSELKAQLNLTESVLLIVDLENMQMAKTAASDAPTVRNVFLFEEIEDMEDDNSEFASLPDPIDARKTPLHVPFSSGTTGKPKGVLLSHFNTLATIAQLSQSQFALTDESDVMLIVLPLYHLYAILMVTSCLLKGNPVVLLPRFRPISFLSAIQEYQCTMIPLVPPLALFLVESPLVEKYDLSSFRKCFSAAAPFPPVLSRKLRARFRLKSLRQGYGMTETGFAAITPNDDLHPTSVGVTLPSTEMKVIDVTSGYTLGPFSIGEICVRGPQVMIGYLNNPTATAGLIDFDSWVHTGDIGYYDDNGQFFYVERIKEIFKHKGHQVAPAELEAVLLTHPSICDAAVVGVPDSRAGETPRAFVVVRKECHLTEANVIHFVQENCSPEKHLRGGVQFLNSIPKSATGKILRNELKCDYVQNH